MKKNIIIFLLACIGVSMMFLGAYLEIKKHCDCNQEVVDK